MEMIEAIYVDWDFVTTRGVGTLDNCWEQSPEPQNASAKKIN